MPTIKLMLAIDHGLAITDVMFEVFPPDISTQVDQSHLMTVRTLELLRAVADGRHETKRVLENALSKSQASMRVLHHRVERADRSLQGEDWR